MGTMTRFKDLHLSPAPKAVLLGFVILIFAFSPTLSHVSQLGLDGTSIAHPTVKQPRDASSWGKMPLFFIANQGQLDNRVAYYVPGSDKTLYFTPGGVTIALADISHNHTTGSRGEHAHSRFILKLEFMGANAVRPFGQEMNHAIISYFKGKPGEWRTGLPTFSKIVYRNLWDGIDLVYSGNVDRLKYEFLVQPGTDPSRIRLAYQGASISLNQEGQLTVSTPAGGFNDDAPVAYQDVGGERVSVTVRYILTDDTTYGFSLGPYHQNLPLVIDPAVLVYCGFIGGGAGESGDSGNGITVDSAGNAYVTGKTDSSEATFPIGVGPDLTFNGNDDAFVAKVRADGLGLVYAGYIGGGFDERGTGIAVDMAGNAYVTGWTTSTQTNFPVTGGPDLTYGGSVDAFVAKVRADGTGLVYTGYIGGDGTDEGRGISVDSAGNAYVAGRTRSTEATFPETIGPDLTHNGGIEDAFVAKVRADGTGLVYAGYIGGNDRDSGNGIAVDLAGYAYVTGDTSSTEATFPIGVGPDLSYNNAGDAFVAKVRADGTGLVYAGYIGGDSNDKGVSLALDSGGNTYITGSTWSTTFPVTGGPDLTFNGGERDAFVAKVRADGTGLVFAGYIGGSSDEDGNGIAVDSAGNAYIAGKTRSDEGSFPVFVGPDLTLNGGEWDAFVGKVKVDGTGLDYCGYIGGIDTDSGHGIAVDWEGSAYITGVTDSTEATFPMLSGPDLTINDWEDAFVAKVADEFSVYLPLIVR
ncbi:MAG: hypothetical protein A2Z16_15255 [Chloroflexi bacterium RBG_16_54_18]|nr:MAG: hypothetical protein A2Z16_15255 [Chloroflexi bacterium RBG_16_54_18]